MGKVGRVRKLIYTLPLLIVLGCGGAFGKAMKRGDQFMENGQWDLAAAEYQKAVELKPNDAEANKKLMEARIRQAAARVQEAKAMLAQNDAEGALPKLQEAVVFDPNNQEAKTLLDDATNRVLDRAEAMLGSGDLDSAFRLTTLALKGKPNDARARSLDGQARDGLATRSYDNATKLEADGKLGAALVDLGAATEYVPGYKDAETKIASLKAKLREQLVYHAVVGRFSGDPKSRGIADELSRAAIDSGFGQMLIKVSNQTPPPGQGFVGMRLGGHVDKYVYDHKQTTSPQTCTYVCGTSVQTNANHTDLKAKLTQSQKDLTAAEADVKKFDAAVVKAERDYDDYARDIDKAQLEVDRARLELEKCQQANPNDPNACGPEQRRLEQELTRLGAAQARAEGPGKVLEQAQVNLSDAVARRDKAAADVAAYKASLEGTPATVEVQKTCDHKYVVTNHNVDASVSVTIRAEALRDNSVVFDDMTSSYRAVDDDATFPPMPGRCSEVANGDPLELKNENDLKKDLATQASASLVTQIKAQYDTYRRAHLDRARRSGTAGVVDEAVDGYVRYLMTTPADVAAKEGHEAKQFIIDNKKVSAATVDRIL